MSLPIISILLLMALVATAVKWRRTGAVFGILSLLVIAGMGLPPLPRYFLDLLQPYDEGAIPAWKAKNAIVVLGAGTVPGRSRIELSSNGRIRVWKAALLYTACKSIPGRSCTLLLSGGDPLKNGATEAEVMARELASLGISANEMILEEQSRNTFQNAKNIASLLKGKNFDLVALTTSGTHMRRAMLFFSFFLINAVPAPADRTSGLSANLPVSFNLVAADTVMHETLGILQFHFYNLMGWNKPPSA